MLFFYVSLIYLFGLRLKTANLEFVSEIVA